MKHNFALETYLFVISFHPNHRAHNPYQDKFRSRNFLKDCLERNTCPQIVRTGFKTRKKYNFSQFKNNHTI